MHRDNSTNQEREETKTLLNRLNGNDPGAAWAEFIDRYSPLIQKLAGQFDYEQDRANDCFLYVCEKLSDNSFRRLLKFNTRGTASFRTWLGTVVFNLCVDWHRKEFGRAILLPAISALPEFDQSVFRLYFEKGMDRRTCLSTLQEEFPDLTATQLCDAISRVHRVLTPRQRWKLGIRLKRLGKRFDDSLDSVELADTADDPEKQARQSEANKLLREALEKLPRELKLAVMLRYTQGMTFQQVADVLELGSLSRARHVIQAALDRLARQIPPSIKNNLR